MYIYTYSCKCPLYFYCLPKIQHLSWKFRVLRAAMVQAFPQLPSGKHLLVDERIYIYTSFKKSDSLRKNTTILQLYEAHIDEIYHSLTQKTWYLLLFAFEIKSKFRPGWYSGLDTKVNEWLWSGIHYMFLYLCHSPITELDDVNIFGKPPIFWWQKQWFPVDCPTNPMNQPICFLMSDIHQFLRIVISATASLKLAYVQELQAPRFLFQNET